MALVRLAKLMTERGLCSRREAEAYMARGLVYVNGVLVKEMGTKVEEDVRITLGSEALEQQKKLRTILFNKPIGIVSAQPEKDYEPAIRLLTLENYHGKNPWPEDPQELRGLAVCGRLDIDSQGLLIFSQDGRLAKKIIGENTLIEKEYLVRFQGEITREKLKHLEYGLELDGDKLKKAQVDQINPDQLRIVLREGKKRQVRRMCELVDLKVLGLKRVRIGKLRLGDLPEGQWRYLLPSDEI